MKATIFLTAAMALLISVATTPAMAADATATMDINSAYVWRGQTFNDGLVLQPSIDVKAKNGLGINVWGNYDIGDYNNTIESNQFSEIDWTLSYSKSLGKLDTSLGVIAYTFPHGGAETAEMYLSLGLPLVAGLSAGLNIYYDFDMFHELTYSNLSLSYAYDISDRLSLGASGSIGYAGQDFAKAAGGKDGGWYDYNLSASLGYKLSSAWSASAHVTYVDALDNDNLKDVKDGGKLDTNVIYGFSIAYAF
jgi:hypothetical protein